MGWARTSAVLAAVGASLMGMPRGVAEYTVAAGSDDAVVTPIEFAAPPVIGYEDGPAADEEAVGTTTTAAPSLAPSTTAKPRATPSTTVAPATNTNSSAQAGSTDPTASAVGAYSLHFNTDGSLVRWNPCQPITWKANLALAPVGALEEIQTAVNRLAAATGMTFQFGGTTNVIPNDAWLHGKADARTIVVAWTSKEATDLFADTADGEGGWYEQGTSANGEVWTWQIVRGYVLMDVGGTVDYAAGFGAGVSRGALLMHELAHAVGLSHVDDATQLMYPTLSRATVADYGSGDLLGLGKVGLAAGCIG